MSTKTCIGCPSYISPEIYAQTTRQAVGASYCRNLGIVLTIPSEHPTQGDRDARLAATARDCSMHNQPIQPQTLPLRDAHLLVTDSSKFRPGTSPDADLIKGCTQCVFYVKPENVIDTWGVKAGLCTAYGQLVTKPQTVTFGSACTVGVYNRKAAEFQIPPSFEIGPWLTGVEMLADAYEGGKAILMGKPGDDPNEYPTDAPVSDDDTARGIRAWRKVNDPSDKSRFVHLPVFRNDFFSDEERVKIPQTGDDEHPELYVDYSDSIYKVAVLWLKLDETPAVWGEPGVGKTELFRHLAWMMQLPFERISITATSEIDDIAGKMLFLDQETKFQYGRIPKAWIKPCVIVLDEPNVGPPEVWHFIRPLTDNSKQMVLDQNRGERIARHDHAFMGLAMNPAWDPRNEGANTIADADSSRLMHIYIELPPMDVEVKIITERIALDGWQMDPKHMKLFMRIAGDIRKLSLDGTIPITWGIRAQLKVARALQWFSPAEAYRIAAADFLEPSVQTSVLDVVRTTAPAKF